MILGINGIIAGRGVIPSTLLNSLVSVYKAESNTNDSFGTNNGTAQGGLTYSTGVDGNAYDLNGTNAYVEVGDKFDLGTDSWTYSTWVYPTNLSFNRTLFTKMSYLATVGAFDFVIVSGLIQFYMQLDSTNNIVIRDNSTIINGSVWTNIVVVIDRTDRVKFYVNGSLSTNVGDLGSFNNNNLSTYSAVNYNTSLPFRIGCSNGTDGLNPTTPTRFFQGKLDELNIWNRALTPTEITELYNSGTGKFYPFTSLTFDSDAQAFISAATITDTTQQGAINQLVLDLKSANIWNKMKAIYPFVGGTASQHRFNLKDPRDLGDAYRLVFNGGVTHSSNGVQFDGATGYANTFLTPSIHLGDNSAHISYYSRTSSTSNSDNYVVGADNASGFFALILRNNNKYFRITNTSTAYEAAGYSGTLSTSGFFIATQDVSNSKLFRNNSNIAQNSGTDNNPRISAIVYIGGSNSYSSPQAYTTTETAFASIGEGLTDADALAFYNAVQTFNTTLNRQVV